jgi:hypothetical protein
VSPGVHVANRWPICSKREGLRWISLDEQAEAPFSPLSREILVSDGYPTPFAPCSLLRMPNQLTLAFTANVANSSYGPAKAAAALAAVDLYENVSNDPVLGQFFGLTVSSDTTTDTATSATRTIVLNMTGVTGSPTAPPPFPCNPITATPPVPPYKLLSPVPLSGSFLTTPGSSVVTTSRNQLPSLTPGAIVQFLAQPGVFYTIEPLGVTATAIALTTAYTGTFSEDDGAVVMVPAPAPIAAIYSTSPLDSNGVAITPALPAGSGARSVQISYLDSTGAGPFTVTTPLMGTFPSPITLAMGSKDIATILSMVVATTGGFNNNVGQITLCQLSSAAPYVAPDATVQQFQALTDQAQGLITRGLVYLPPSYFALAQQSASQPVLTGEFLLPGRLAAASPLTPGGVVVGTTKNQVGILVAGNMIEFAAQPGTLYTIAAVGPGNITLTTPYTGLNDNPLLSSATLISPSLVGEPSNAQLSTLTSEFVNPGTAVPPPNPPFAPQTMSPSPSFLSGLFARTLQLAVAVPVVPSAIVLS